MTELRFDGLVAVLTGSGRGIGAAYAELLAARGAHVVVNDIGGSMSGRGGGAGPAAAVAERIVGSGGSAVSDTSDVCSAAGAQALVDRAVDSFGRLDVVVNNAGIYWTDGFPDVEPQDMARQWEVHVGGALNVTRAAWPLLRRSGSGRVVMTTSTGALGSAELAAYGTAKAGVLGLGRSLAMSGAPHGIKVNIVAPMAMTRMMNASTGSAEVPDVPERAPALVAPLVALLCHPRCPTTGETFVSGMRRITRLVIAETPGYLHPGLDLAVEDVLEHWDRIVDTTTTVPRTDTMTWSEANQDVLARRALAAD